MPSVIRVIKTYSRLEPEDSFNPYGCNRRQDNNMQASFFFRFVNGVKFVHVARLMIVAFS